MAGKFKPIDRFFESPASEVRERAIGVVLSGSGPDGTVGISAIKDAGGITFAQSEESTEFADMPRSAIRSGQVDFVYDPADMARELGELGQHPYLRKPQAISEEVDLPEWERIQQMLKTTGIDFSKYKQSTVRRRITRRMAIHFTAQALSKNKKECLEAGMDNVVTRPIDMEKLQFLIQLYLGNTNPEFGARRTSTKFLD